MRGLLYFRFRCWHKTSTAERLSTGNSVAAGKGCPCGDKAAEIGVEIGYRDIRDGGGDRRHQMSKK